MHEIVVYRTHVEITNYKKGDCPYIEKKHSVKRMITQKYFQMEPKGMEYDAQRRVLMLPRGVDIERLKWTLGDDTTVRILTEFDALENMTTKLNIKYTPRDEDQKAAIKFIMGLDEYAYTSHYSMISLNLNTGKGKSYCAIASMALKNMRTVIITDTNGCLEQWGSYFQQYTDISPNEICLLDPSNIHRFIKSGKRYSVYLILHATLRAYANRYGWQGVTELFNFMRVGAKIFDEAHLDMDNMFKIDCYTNTFFNLYITATPNRSNYEEDKIFQEYFTGVPMIDLFHEDVDPHTMYAAIKYSSNPSAYDISKCRNNYGLDRHGYADYVVQKEEFRCLLHILIQQALSKPGKSLWYIGTNNAIWVVRDWIYDNYPELVTSIGVFNGQIPKEERREELDKKIILTNTKSAGVALDISGLVECVILAEPFKSRVLAQQTFGRTRADGTIYKELVDRGFRDILKYYNFKRPTFNKYATKCAEIALTDHELKERAKAILLERIHLYCPFSFVDPRTGEFVKKYRTPIYTDDDLIVK